jgi:hypothetical protein
MGQPKLMGELPFLLHEGVFAKNLAVSGLLDRMRYFAIL